MPEVVVVGQIARDLVLRVDEVPGSGGTAAVRERREMLGGKGASQAVGLAQLKVASALVAVLGDDDTATALLDQARRDGVDTTHIVRRSGARTGLIVDIVTDGWRYLEDLPGEMYLTEADVAAAAGRQRAPGRGPGRPRCSACLESVTIDHETPMSAYLALDTRLPDYPDRDTALGRKVPAVGTLSPCP